MAKEALNIEEFEEEDFDEVSSEEEIDADVDVEDVPDGGIGDFVMSDEDLDAVYGETDEDLDDERVASLPAIAARMAEYGRNEDDTLAHVATGELVIPAQFLKDDVIKQRIYDILSEAGVDNPEAYVVGADENDLNPDTGLPEFFLKKLFKGVGKAIKGVVKVVKKALPVVLPIALGVLTPLGPIFGAALGSGIGTLVNGGSIGDALKSGLMSGAAGGLFAGFTGAGSFTENVRGAFGDVGGRFSQFGDSIRAGNFGGGEYVSGVPVTPAQAADAATNAPTAQMGGGDITMGSATPGSDALSAATGKGMFSNQVLETAAANGIKDPNFISIGQKITLPNGAVHTVQSGETLSGILAQSNVLTPPVSPLNSNLTPVQAKSIVPTATTAPTAPTAGDLFNFNAADGQRNVNLGLQNLNKIPENVPISDQLRGYVDKTKEFFFPSGPSQEVLREGYKKHVAELGAKATEEGFAEYVKKQGPSLLRKYGPLAGAGLAVMGAAGGFDTPDGEISPLSGIRLNPDGTPMTARDIMAADPERFRIYSGRNLDPNTGLYINPAKGQSAPSMVQDAYAKAIEQQLYFAKPALDLYPNELSGGRGMADGGHVFPRRNGGISPDEGIAGKDSVKAMLMPGEFVMTTKAVRGLGNGNLNNGIKNMYSVMRNLEKRGRAA